MSFVEIVLVALAAINALTFLAFGWDKWMARRGSWRTPEKRLYLLTFLAGVFGAWAGMRVFRHKTRKASFRWRIVLVSVVNPMWPILWWLITRDAG
jgi:uncharacterized membrane protein YsdA (DUF1294 family)